MRYDRFDAPALLNEFATEEQKKKWSEQVSGYFDQGVRWNRRFNAASQFYNPLKTDTAEPFSEALIDWPGFPKLVKDEFPLNPEQAWAKAEKDVAARLDYMDEYLEWHVIRNSSGKITRVSFTCETTQYYNFLAVNNPAKLLSVYCDIVDPAYKDQVKLEDLIVGGQYHPENKWNTDHGAVHLIQPNNNLYAEIMIAAQASVLRKRADGTPITDSAELIDCAGYGEKGRSSDPKIGAIVNDKARHGYSITLRNPIALYMTHWDSSGWRKPNGDPVGNYWTLVRGTKATAPGKPSLGLHLVYEVPANEGFVVGDIKIGPRNIKYGGQIAENINVGLIGLISREGQSHNPGFLCSQTAAEHPPAQPHTFSLEAEAEISPAELLPLRAKKK